MTIRSGFTLLETVLFTGIVAIMGGAVVSFFLLSNQVGVQNDAIANVEQTGGFAIEAVTRRVQAAESVDATADTLTLTMDDADLNPTVIDLAGGRLRVTEGGAVSYLTPDTMDVTNLAFVLLGTTVMTKRGMTVSFNICNDPQENLAQLLGYCQDFHSTIAGKEGAVISSSSSSTSSASSSSSSSSSSSASEVVIDPSVGGETDEAQIQRTPALVFTSDLTGYVFYVNDDGRCLYAKSTDGGATWGAGVQVTAQTDCEGAAIWYDQWTPGDTTGRNVHIAFIDDGGNDLWYQRLDTTTDTLLVSEANISGAGQGGSIDLDNRFSITKATDGKLYAALADDSDRYILSCTASCETASNWTEITNILEAAENDVKLLPLAGGGIMALEWDLSADDIHSKVWNGSSWSGSWTVVDNSAQDHDEYKTAWGATVKRSTNEIFLVWNDHVADSSGKIRTAVYNGSWSQRTDIATSHHGYGVDIAFAENSGVYVARLKRIASEDTNVLVSFSGDDMQTWGGDTQANAQPLDYEAISLNMMSPWRIYGMWWDEDTYRLLGKTIADLP